MHVFNSSPILIAVFSAYNYRLVKPISLCSRADQLLGLYLIFMLSKNVLIPTSGGNLVHSDNIKEPGVALLT